HAAARTRRGPRAGVRRRRRGPARRAAPGGDRRGDRSADRVDRGANFRVASRLIAPARAGEALAMRVLPLLALAAIPPGCGAISEDDYLTRVTKDSETVQVAIAGTTPESGRLEQSSRAIGRAADDLDGVHPPGKDKRLNEHMVAGFRGLAGSYHAAAEAARK